MFGLFGSKLKKIQEKLTSLLSRPLDPPLVEELEKELLHADLGTNITKDILEFIRKNHNKYPSPLFGVRQYLEDIFKEHPEGQSIIFDHKPHVIFVVGVNGSGKTTTTAKLANFYKNLGLSSMMVGADTFRAGALDQLSHWSSLIDVPVVLGKKGMDPASVVFDGLQSSKNRLFDLAIIDTAGRLESKKGLMEELKKMIGITKKVLDVPHYDIYCTLDASIGQNGIDQIETFNNIVPLNGIILNKTDGSAKGGTAVSIYNRLKIPIRYVGFGEKIDDFAPFSPTHYIDQFVSQPTN